VTRRNKQIAAVVCLVAIVGFTAWPLYKWLYVRTASDALYERTRSLVEKNPRLKPSWDKALEDGELTRDEAKGIVEQAGETLGPDD
jgi:hypothetical protein